MSRSYSDHERQKIANEEYKSYSPNNDFEIINDNGRLEPIFLKKAHRKEVVYLCYIISELILIYL